MPYNISMARKLFTLQDLIDQNILALAETQRRSVAWMEQEKAVSCQAIVLRADGRVQEVKIWATGRWKAVKTLGKTVG